MTDMYRMTRGREVDGDGNDASNAPALMIYITVS